MHLLNPVLPLAIVWRAGTHRCEYCKGPGNQAHLRLYDVSGLKMERVVTTIEEMRATAMSWRESVMAVVDHADRPRIERGVERRKIPRAGRRDTDPVPICPSCGLPGANRHGSDPECVAALRLEVSRIRAQRRERFTA